MTEPSIHIHEDDWGMRNLYPAAALTEASADVARAIEAGERNRVPDGFGWTDLHLIGEPSIDYAAAELILSSAADALSPIMPRVRRFTATAMAGFALGASDSWGTYDQDAYCYGFDALCFIKLEPEGGLVKRVWFEGRTAEPERLAALRQAIEAVDALVPSVVADYWEDQIGAIRDTLFLDQYFQQLAGREA